MNKKRTIMIKFENILNYFQFFFKQFAIYLFDKLFAFLLWFIYLLIYFLLFLLN